MAFVGNASKTKSTCCWTVKPAVIILILGDKMKLNLSGNRESLNRPAWSMIGGFEAYKHKHVQPSRKHPTGLIENYYVDSGGLQ